MICIALFVGFLGTLSAQPVNPQQGSTTQSSPAVPSGTSNAAQDKVPREQSGNTVQAEAEAALMLRVRRDDDEDLIFQFDDLICDAPAIEEELKKQISKHGGRAVLAIFDDSVTCSDYKIVLDLATRVGFQKFASFVTWKKSGNVSEVFLSRHDGEYVEVTYGQEQPVPSKRKQLMKVLAHMRPL